MTERNSSERVRELEAIAERYQALVDHAPVAIFVNREDRVVLANAACLQLFGATHPEQLVGKSPYELFHPDDHPRMRERIRRLRDLGQVAAVVEERILRLDGTSVVVEVGAAPFRDGDVNAIHVVLRDITLRKAAEASLTRSVREAERFREALDRVPALIYMKGPDHRYLYANRPTLELFGCSPVELVGRSDADFFPAATVARLADVDARVHAGQRTEEEIDVPDAKGGRRVYWEVKTPIRTAQGPVEGLLGISTDITERKQSEERLAAQVDELRRWKQATIGREDRIRELKSEVNELLARAGQPPRYPSVVTAPPTKRTSDP